MMKREVKKYGDDTHLELAGHHFLSLLGYLNIPQGNQWQKKGLVFPGAY